MGAPPPPPPPPLESGSGWGFTGAPSLLFPRPAPCQGSDLTHQRKLGFKHFLLCLCIASVLELFPTIHVNDHETAADGTVLAESEPVDEE